MSTFYTGVDQQIYKGGDHYVPMEKFRLNPYEQKNLSYESSQPKSYGITNTNAFTNSGGSFSPSGNAFGYGSAMKPGDPSVLTEGPYAGQSGYYGSINYQGGLPGNVAQKGPGRHFQYDNSGNFYRDYSLTPKKELPGFVKGIAGFVPFGMSAVNFIENKMNPTGPMTLDDVNKGSYKMGGLDTIGKKAYNELAGKGMLFEGPSGIKTLTGKNFGAKGYFEGQAELAKEFGFDQMSDDEISDYIENFSITNPKKTFTLKQMKEAWKVSKYQHEKMVEEKLKADIEEAAAKRQKDIKIAQSTPLGGSDGTSGGDFRGGAEFRGANPYGGSGTKDDMGADSFAFKYGGLASIL